MVEKVSNHIKMKNKLKNIFFAGLDSVKPHTLIQSKIKIDDNNLLINNQKFPLNDKVYLVGFGKAVMGMAMEMEKLLGKRLVRGIISVPKGSMKESFITSDNYDSVKPKGVVSYYESCENNQADLKTLKVTESIMELAKSLKKNDVLIVLISGGGSALLSMPKTLISLEEKNELWKKLQNVGADIKEVNIIRGKLSVIKAGGLADLAYPATVIALILSDIVGDPIELIAGGPTCYVSIDPSKVIEILEKYHLYKYIDDKMKMILMENDLNDRKHFYGFKDCTHVNNFIIGNNSCVIDAAKNYASRNGLQALVLFQDIQGLVKDISNMYVGVAELFCDLLNELITTKQEFTERIKSCKYLKKLEERFDEIMHIIANTDDEGLVIIGGGECVVEINGTGKGGRNQELALQFSLDCYQEMKKNINLKKFEIMFLSAGTDGQDGPTDAAGAFGYADIASKNMSIEQYLMNNDSYNFYSNFESGKYLFKTGFTGTNVMDLHFLYIKKK